MEDASAVTAEKFFIDRNPRTTHELTDAGRRSFEGHIGTRKALIDGLEE